MSPGITRKEEKVVIGQANGHQEAKNSLLTNLDNSLLIRYLFPNAHQELLSAANNDPTYLFNKFASLAGSSGLSQLLHEEMSNGFTEDSSENTRFSKTTNKANKGKKNKKDNDNDDSNNNAVNDNVFSINIAYNNIDTLELQVTPYEMVQEIHQVLMEREETYHRTCFSLRLLNSADHGHTVLDQFAELKTIPNLKEGSTLTIFEEPYTLREVRLHVKHLRDILSTFDLSDALAGAEGASISYVNVIVGGPENESSDHGDKFTSNGTNHHKSSRKINGLGYSNTTKNGQSNNYVDDDTTLDASLIPPAYLLPHNSTDSDISPFPLTALHPIDLKEPPLCCLKQIAFNHWNPPPGPRKMKGDLAYLTIITLEDKHLHITACTKGFYLNQSTEELFNPLPQIHSQTYHAIIDLLNKVSPSFKRNLQTIVKKRSRQNALEKAPIPVQKYCWIMPFLEHRADAFRAEDMMESRLGFEDHVPGQTRDWNEELQATRELPRGDLLSRVARDRAIFKVGSDFVATALKGTLSVTHGNALPINPGEGPKMHMYIWNNIFFSLGFDIRDHYKALGGDDAAYIAPANDLRGVELYSDVDLEGLHTLGTVIIDYKGLRVTGQTIIPGILEREQEELVVYGSIDPSNASNNTSNLDSTKAASPHKDVVKGSSPFKVNAGAFKHQPGDDPSVNNDEKNEKIRIKSHPDYDKLLSEAALKLRIASHKVYTEFDSVPHNNIENSPNLPNPGGFVSKQSPENTENKPDSVVELHTSYECKGIIGNDRRHYLLDLYRTLPPDMNFVHVNNSSCTLSPVALRLGLLPDTSYKHQLAILRPELIEAFTEYVLLIRNNCETPKNPNIGDEETQNVGKGIMYDEDGLNNEYLQTKHLINNNTHSYQNDSNSGVQNPTSQPMFNSYLGIEHSNNDNTRNINCIYNNNKGENTEDGLKKSEVVTKSDHALVMALENDKDSAIDSLENHSPDAGNSDEEESSLNNKTLDQTKASDQKSMHESENPIRSKDGHGESHLIKREPMKFRTKFPVSVDALRFNPDAFLDVVRHVKEEDTQLHAQKNLLLDAADFVVCHQLPELINDFKEHTSVPIDGASLIDMMHVKGINVRYLGILLKQIETESTLNYLANIVYQELITRSAKHIYKTMLQNTETGHLARAIAHFLNCYLGLVMSGSCENVSTSPLPAVNGNSNGEPGHKNGKKKNRKRKNLLTQHNNENKIDWSTKNSVSLWEEIVADIYRSYFYQIYDRFESFDQFARAKGYKMLTFLRTFCLQSGIQLVLRDYAVPNYNCSNEQPSLTNFNGASITLPHAPSHNINTTNTQAQFTTTTNSYNIHQNVIIFHEDDILNIVPVIKHISHKASDAHTFFLAGQTKIQQGCLKDGFELISESLNLMNTVYGPLHPEICSCLRLLARICYILGDRIQALSFQQKATIMSERLYGIDHANTIIDYINLALYYVANFRINYALKLLYRARYLLLIVAENGHPEFIALDSNLGLVLYANGLYDQSMLYLENALCLSKMYYGESSLKTAVVHHLIAGVHSCKGDFRTAIATEKRAFTIYKNLLGENHEKTIESGTCLRHLTQQAVAMQKCINASTNSNAISNILNNTGSSHPTNGSKGNSVGSSHNGILNNIPFLPSLHIQKPSLSAILDLMNVINGIIFVQIKPYDLEKLTDSEKQLILAAAHKLSTSFSNDPSARLLSHKTADITELD